LAFATTFALASAATFALASATTSDHCFGLDFFIFGFGCGVTHIFYILYIIYI
jgi:hypothetical protein